MMQFDSYLHGETDGPERFSKAKRTRLRQNEGLIVDVNGRDRFGKTRFERHFMKFYRTVLHDLSKEE